jgi:hypothetical protein
MYPVCFVNYVTSLYRDIVVPLWRGCREATGEEKSEELETKNFHPLDPLPVEDTKALTVLQQQNMSLRILRWRRCHVVTEVDRRGGGHKMKKY